MKRKGFPALPFHSVGSYLLLEALEELFHLYRYAGAVVAELLVEYLVRCGVSEMVETVYEPVVAHKGTQVYGEPRGETVARYSRRQYLADIRRTLVAEQSLRGNGYDSRRNTLLCQELCGVGQCGDFRTVCYQEHVGFCDIGYHVSPLVQFFCLFFAVAGQVFDVLAREDERYGALLLDGEFPCGDRLLAVGGTQYDHRPFAPVMRADRRMAGIM